MNNTYFEQALVIFQLLSRDFYLFRQIFLHKMKVALYWILISVFITKMFLPAMGLENFGSLILISSTISYGLFIGMENAMNLVNDITSNQAIAYELTLPVPQWLIFFKIALSNMLQGLIISLCLVPCGFIVLMDLHAFPDFSFLKFIIIFICSSIFYGSFSLILATYLKDMSHVDSVWLRILFPMWYLGCFQFPWSALYNISPIMAYIDLLNPMTLIMEAGRSATINSAGSLNFTFCCIMILVYAACSLKIGIHFMKKRLNCI